jgi:hypothetical protein
MTVDSTRSGSYELSGVNGTSPEGDADVSSDGSPVDGEQVSAEPASLMRALLLGECRSVGLHGEYAKVRLESAELRWRLLADEQIIEVAGPSGTIELAPERWGAVYRDDDRGQLTAYDREGRRRVECEVTDWRSELPGVEEPAGAVVGGESAAEGSVRRFPDVTLHTTVFDDETYAEAWRRSEDYAETHRLERAARTTRGEMLEGLPERLAAAVAPRRVLSMFEALPDGNSPITVDVFGRGYRGSMHVDQAATMRHGTRLLASGENLHLACDGRIGGAYLVGLPVGDSMRRALELVDESGRIAARLRLRREATPSEVIDWRAGVKRVSRGETLEG